MSDRDDLRMYYNGTVFAIPDPKRAGIRNVFRVMDVNEARKGHGFERFDLYGTLTTRDEFGNFHDQNYIVPYTQDLVQRMPDLGYCMLPRLSVHPLWIAYNPIRKPSKGLSHQRLNMRGVDLHNSDYWMMFNPDFEGLIHEDLCIWEGKILYKGHVAGKVLKTKINLHESMKHIEEEVCQYCSSKSLL